MDTANPRPDLLEAILRVSDRVPGLRIVVDHLPGILGWLDAAARPEVEANLRELAKRPAVYFNRRLMRMVDGKASTDPPVYKHVLDQNVRHLR